MLCSSCEEKWADSNGSASRGRAQCKNRLLASSGRGWEVENDLANGTPFTNPVPIFFSHVHCSVNMKKMSEGNHRMFGDVCWFNCRRLLLRVVCCVPTGGKIGTGGNFFHLFLWAKWKSSGVRELRDCWSGMFADNLLVWMVYESGYLD